MTLALALVVVSAAGADVPETYAVQPGDTCASIARKFFGSDKQYTQVHTYNDLGPPPHKLEVGRVLRLRPAPAGAPSAEATLTFLKPAVRARHLIDWVPATLEMSLFRNDEVSTLKGAGAEVTFPDSSWLLMDQNALIVIYGEARRPKEPEGIGLVDGELRLALASLRSARSVKLPAATLVAQKAVGVVSTDRARTTRVSVFQGDGEVSAQGKKVKVPQNHGTRVLDGNAPEPARLLPGAPELALSPVVVVPASSEGARTRLAWAAAPRAARYRVQLAADDRFAERDRDEFVSGLELDSGVLTRDRTFVRVIAYDELELQSAPSRVVQVLVVAWPGLADGAARVVPRGTPFQLSAPEGMEVLVDGKVATPPLTLPVGAHRVVLRSGTEVAFEQEVLVPPAPPELSITGRGEQRTLRLRFADPIAPGDEPTVTGPAGPLTLVRTDERTFEAALTAGGSYLTSWRSRELSRIELP